VHSPRLHRSALCADLITSDYKYRSASLLLMEAENDVDGKWNFPAAIRLLRCNESEWVALSKIDAASPLPLSSQCIAWLTSTRAMFCSVQMDICIGTICLILVLCLREISTGAVQRRANDERSPTLCTAEWPHYHRTSCKILSTGA
jgi:hypothetical protein